MGINDLRFSRVVHELQSSVTDLYKVNSALGLFRFCSLGIVCLSLIGLAWSSQNPWLFTGYTAIAGLVYAFWFVCVHDATHHTLTGWKWFDESMPLLISYPMMWTQGAYTHLHRLHHGWNGTNLQDPERVQWTLEEYQKASPWVQWYVRHQWGIDVFGWGGFGMIGKTIFKAWKLGAQMPAIRRSLLLDGLGILLVQAGLVAWSLSAHHLLRYVIFWLILERVIGAVIQTRDHIEHYGMWTKAPGHQLTQLYSCRNLAVHPIVSWLMGGLDYHAVHHAFPTIPFNQLPEAFRRIQLVLEQNQLPEMTVGSGYIREAQRLSAQPSLIGERNATDAIGHHQMIAI